ncbi:MAG: glycoside hydrolase [Pseudopedobacter saltans]|uniref:Glycoside hydrolase n=1 Tax=Pseudopedobacter saltans TaxID=151895 RepID=A0A2W5FF70_9SPHI|nr:MAG: glycoside hydrolase [Pseudopedobacter saltans]
MVQADNELDMATRTNKYLPQILDVIEKYKDSRPPTVGYASYKVGDHADDRFYDDNQWIGIAAFDAYKRTKQKKYLQLGKDIYRFMMSGYDTVSGGGIYWVENNKNSKNTCSNGPGVLVALGVYENTKKKVYLDTAILIYNWTAKYLRAPNGLYYDNYNIKKKIIDSALYSYNAGTMLESAAWLYQITGKKSYLDEAKTIAASAADHFLGNGIFKDDYWFNAVMLRGYLRLYSIDHNQQYIEMFRKCLDYTIHNQQQKDGLYGRSKIENLVAQAGLLEMLSRFAILQDQNNYSKRK